MRLPDRYHAAPAAVEDVGVDHRRGHVPVAEKLLDHPQVVRAHAADCDVLMVDGYDDRSLVEELASQRFYDDCAAALHDPSGIGPCELADLVTAVDHALIAFHDSINRDALAQRRTHHSAQRGIHTRRITAAGEDANPGPTPQDLCTTVAVHPCPPIPALSTRTSKRFSSILPLGPAPFRGGR